MFPDHLLLRAARASDEFFEHHKFRGFSYDEVGYSLHKEKSNFIIKLFINTIKKI